MKSAIRRVFGSETFRHGFLVLAATMLGNVASFGYHAVVSRKLGVAEYGELYALISFTALVTLPIAFFPTVIAKYAAEFQSLGDDGHLKALVGFVQKSFGLLALAVCLAIAIGAAPLSRFLHVSVWLIAPAAALAGISTFGPIVRAVLQGQGDFAAFSFASASEGFGKLILGALFTSIGFGVFGGIAGFAAGGLCGICYATWVLWAQLRKTTPAPFHVDWRRVRQTSFGAAAVSAAIAILTSSDVVLVKHFFNASDAGLYSAASLGGKILLFAAGFAPTIVLPKATQRHARGEATRSTLIGAAIMLLTIAVGGLFTFEFAGRLVLHLLVGSQFEQATPLLVAYAIAMTFLAGTSLICSYGLALHRLTFALPLIAAALAEPALIALYHPSLVAVVSVAIAVNALALVVSAVAVFLDSRKPLRRIERSA